MSNSSTPASLLHAAVRFALGALLFYAGFTKLNTPAAFAEAIANFRVLPAQANQILAVTLPFLEVLTGALLVFGIWSRAAALVACALFTGFSVAVVMALARGLDIQCGCFGTGAAAKLGAQTLAIDLAALSAAVYLAVTAREFPLPLGERADVSGANAG